jgi:hypothetical protein
MRTRMQKLMIIAPLAILGMVLFVFVGGVIVQYLWNWLLPTLFDWKEITFWQALGLLALCRILFGGFGMRGYGRSGVRRRVQERMAERMEERCANMTPEERERFRERMRERWGCPSPADGTKGQ